jgi:hypothetical protein
VGVVRVGVVRVGVVRVGVVRVGVVRIGVGALGVRPADIRHDRGFVRQHSAPQSQLHALSMARCITCPY